MQRTPLHIAAEEGARDKVLLLLAHGADPSATDKNMWTPLHCAASGVRFRSPCPLLSRLSLPTMEVLPSIVHRLDTAPMVSRGH